MPLKRDIIRIPLFEIEKKKAVCKKLIELFSLKLNGNKYRLFPEPTINFGNANIMPEKGVNFLGRALESLFDRSLRRTLVLRKYKSA